MKIILNVITLIYVTLLILVLAILISIAPLLTKVLIFPHVLVNVIIIKIKTLALTPISNGMLRAVNVHAIFPQIDMVSLNVLKDKFMMLPIVPVTCPQLLKIVPNLFKYFLQLMMMVIS